ncbi:MAG: SurA N-terminal domain-containing protein [Nitrospinae bacterium]|nr:SurA N-terminal domain-containing protein [Nitrospinota bacterium]
MVQINFAKKEVSCKIVYYGPGLSGKTTNLEIIYKKAPDSNKGKMTSVATEGDRTLFFDFLPLDIGKVGGMNTKFQLYTVPGQVYYNSTRKLVLQGVDGVIFVANSEKGKMDENIESLKNLEDNLKEQGINISEIPLVIQFNKRDLPDATPVAEMEAKLNPWKVPTCEASAFRGEGVFPTLKLTAAIVLDRLNKKYAPKSASDKAIAEVNGHKLLLADFEKFCVTHYRLSGKKEPPGGAKFSRSEKENYLNIYINNFLIRLAAKEQGIEADEKAVAAQIEGAASKFGSKDNFIKYLKEKNLTEEDYKEEAVNRTLSNKLLAGIIPDHRDRISPKEEQLREVYEKNRDKFPGAFDQERKKVEAQALKTNRLQVMEEMYKEIRSEARIKTYL